MIELNSKNSWRAAFILLLWAFVFNLVHATRLAEICGVSGGLLFVFMCVVRFEDVAEFLDRS